MVGWCACAWSFPARLGRHPEDVLSDVLVAVLGGLFTPLGQHPGVKLLEGVGDVLQEDQAQDDVLVLGGVHASAQGVGHLPELRLVAGGGLGGGQYSSGGGLLRWLLVKGYERGCGVSTGPEWESRPPSFALSLSKGAWPAIVRPELVEGRWPWSLLQSGFSSIGQFRRP